MKDSDKTKKRDGKQPKKTIAVPIDSKSFLALLIRSFFFSTLFIVISVVCIFYLSDWITTKDVFSIYGKDLSSYSTELKQGQYNKIPVSRVLGNDGWLEITDSGGNVIYSTLETPTASYTLGELDSIQRHDSTDVITAHEFGASGGRRHYFITITTQTDSGESESYLLLDSDLRVISGTYAINKNQYTQREFDFLTYNTSHEDGKLEKIVFNGNDGKMYCAVYLCRVPAINYAPPLIIGITVTLVVILYVVVMVFYIRYINKRFRQPLNALDSAMTSFAKDGYRKPLDYKGVLEFEQLCDTFNEMVTLLNESETRRSSLEKDKQRMLAGLSHDLKTPMTVIQGYSKAIRDGVVEEKDRQKYLDLIIAKSEHMSELINEFYEYSKLDHPDFTLQCAKIDIAEAVRSALGYHYEEFALRGYELETDISEEPVYCNIDKQQAVRVMDNLLSNFYKYTSAGSTFFVSLKAEDGFVRIDVADNGSGIPKEVRDDIFEPFVVGERSRNGQSSGLGLSVCKRIIEMHGGTIALADAEELGTHFQIKLPLSEQ